MASQPKELFTPVKLGSLNLQHRIALAPLTRARSDRNGVPSPLAATYYSQRASTPGTFLITEATYIAERGWGYPNAPGIWSEPQVDAWKEITDAVHAKVLPPQYDVVSSGDISFGSLHKPRPLTANEIDEYVELWVQASRNALRAGFDGIEIHSANGFLLDQFLQTTSNNRTDEYGGSVENRIRFALRVAQAVSEAIGADRVGIRLSPYERFQGMYMEHEELISTFSTLIERLSKLNLGYLHLTEPRVSGQLASGLEIFGLPENLDWATEIWKKTDHPVLLSGGYTPDVAESRVAEGKRRGEQVIIVFGRYYISNPDLPERIRKGIPFNLYHRPTFAAVGDTPEHGYTDYPFATD